MTLAGHLPEPSAWLSPAALERTLAYLRDLISEDHRAMNLPPISLMSEARDLAEKHDGSACIVLIRQEYDAADQPLGVAVDMTTPDDDRTLEIMSEALLQALLKRALITAPHCPVCADRATRAAAALAIIAGDTPMESVSDAPAERVH